MFLNVLFPNEVKNKEHILKRRLIVFSIPFYTSRDTEHTFRYEYFSSYLINKADVGFKNVLAIFYNR